MGYRNQTSSEYATDMPQRLIVAGVPSEVRCDHAFLFSAVNARDDHRVSQRRASDILNTDRTSGRHRSRRHHVIHLRDAVKTMAIIRRRFC